VVFAGFSAEALRDRIIEGRCRFVITADEVRHRESRHPLDSHAGWR
jgi:acyl-coenzyme A synthetase/AMP-(fatty) acid ligase